MTLEEIRARAVTDAITRHKGNRAHAGKELGLASRSIRYYIQTLIPRYPELINEYTISNEDIARHFREARDRRSEGFVTAPRAH